MLDLEIPPVLRGACRAAVSVIPDERQRRPLVVRHQFAPGKRRQRREVMTHPLLHLRLQRAILRVAAPISVYEHAVPFSEAAIVKLRIRFEQPSIPAPSASHSRDWSPAVSAPTDSAPCSSDHRQGTTPCCIARFPAGEGTFRSTAPMGRNKPLLPTYATLKIVSPGNWYSQPTLKL